MKSFLKLLAALVMSISLETESGAQTLAPVPVPLDAKTVAAHAVAAFSSLPVQQIQLTGTAKGYAGSTQPSGSFSVTVKSTGESTLQLNLAELTRTESSGAFSGAPQCKWAGVDGVQHDVAQHNCLLPVHWIVPVFALGSQVNKLNASVAAGADQSVAEQALSLNQPAVDATTAGQKLAQLSSARLSLDSNTKLPSSLSFDVHPDRDEGINIPIVVRYSDYRQVSGVTLPFHIQKYLNNGLILDLQVENAVVQ